MVMQSDDFYSLTSAGMDLLARFKAYKRMHGQPLPSADDPYSDDDRDEAEDQLTKSSVQPANEQDKPNIEDNLMDYSIEDDDGRIRDRVA